MATGDITWFRYKRHDGVEQRVSRLDMDLPGHHSHYSYLQEITPMETDGNYRFEKTQTDKIYGGIGRLETDSDKRKEMPIYSGVLRYFPDALAEIARLSKIGNAKHNPGEPLHWTRGKSADQLDCLCRHLAECGTVDTDGLYHDVKVAWRALANLQELLEKERGLPISPGSRAAPKPLTFRELPSEGHDWPDSVDDGA